jgi:hypothetical protein
MEILITGKNVFKSRGFCPNPVAKYGIPEYADSITFPSVVDTEDWWKYWEEQVYYCLNGYETGGLWIPGRYYYYLNFSYISTVGIGYQHPDFVDTDLDFYYTVEYCKKTGRGIICIKARRKGLSFKANKGIIEYGTRFLGDAYKAGVCAGLENYALDFAVKLTETESLTVPELKVHTVKSNEGERIYGYYVKDEQGKFVLDGSKNKVLIRTAFQSGNIFKGLDLEDCIFEESGEFPNLSETYEATKWCFMDGDRMRGTPYIYGTGGKMATSSKAFNEMWVDHEAFKLERFWVPGTRIYKPCYVGCTNELGEDGSETPNIDREYADKNVSPEQLLGMEDFKESEFRILEDRKIFARAKNKKKLTEHIQNLPLTVEEAFVSSADNNYDSAILNSRTLELMQSELLYQEMVIEPKMDEKGGLVFPIEPYFRLPNRDGMGRITDPDWKIVNVYKFPKKEIRFLDAVGIDSYDQDTSSTSSSLGGILVYRQPFQGLDYYGPILTYYKRPPRKEDFFMIAYLIMKAYSWPNYSMVDQGSPTIIDWIINHGGEYLLGYRPKAFESPNSEQRHTYGMKFTTWNRPISEGMVQSEILDNAMNWPFPELCKDCAAYNTGDNENDQDLHDALILAMAQHKDRKIYPSSDLKENNVQNSEPVIRTSPEGYVYYDSTDAKDNGRFGGDMFMNLLSQGEIGK